MEGTGHGFQKTSRHWLQTWRQSRQEECMNLKESSPSSTGEREDFPATGLLSSKQLPESLEVLRGNSG